MASPHMRLFLQGVAAALLSLSSVQPTRAQATPEPIRFATDTVFVRDEAGAAQAAGAASVADLLAFRAPWLLVTRPSGSVGEAVSLSLREPSRGAPPVVVYVDGVRLDALPLPALTLRTPDPLLEIDPEAVERIELVRGAVASARWGSDAAGGVLLVTTRAPRAAGMRQSATVTLGAVTPGPMYGRVWRTCTEADPVVECSGRAEGEVVSVDGLAQSGLVESRMLHALRWSGAYGRGPFSAAASLMSEDRPGAFAGEGFERRIGSVDLGLALHRTLRLDLWGVLADVEPGLERDVRTDIGCQSVLWPTVTENLSLCGPARTPRGEDDLEARRFGATVAHAPLPWLMHRVTASGHAVREIATTRYLGDVGERGEIGRWQGAWEYEVRGVRPSGGPAGWSIGAEAAVRSERGDRETHRAAGSLPTLGSRVSTLSGFSRMRARTAVEVAWRSRARLVAGLMYEDGEPAAELRASDGIEHHVLPSMSAEYAWPNVRVRAAWGRARVSGGFDAFFPGLSDAPPRWLGAESETTEAGVAADLLGGRLRAAAAASRTVASTQYIASGAAGTFAQDVETRTDALEASLEATLLRSGSSRWDVGAALVGLRARVTDIPVPWYFGTSRELRAMIVGEWPGTYTSVEVVRVDTVAGVVTVSPDRRPAGHLDPSLEAVLRTAVASGRARLDAAVQVREGNTVFNEVAAARVSLRTARELHDPSVSAVQRLVRVGPFVTTEGGEVLDAGAYLEDGSFVRLRHVALTLALPPRIGGHRLPTGDLTLAGHDLVTFSGYSGPDPEVVGLAPSHPRRLVSRLTLRF